jgi:hypothetical protein
MACLIVILSECNYHDDSLSTVEILQAQGWDKLGLSHGQGLQ